MHDKLDPTTDAAFILAEASVHGPSGAIEAQERRGQQAFVQSEMLPTNLNPKDESAWTDLGFTLGDTDPADPLFRTATLPAGWTRKTSDHPMWSYIVDEHGRNRVSVFYKAAFYDRGAHAALLDPDAYVVQVAGGGAELVLDDTWATREEVIAFAEQAAATYWDKDLRPVFAQLAARLKGE